jgi:endonuclease G
MPVWNPASAENVAETLEEAKRTRAPRREASFDAPFDEAYDKRKGYEEDYLGKADFNVRMPTLTAALKQHAVRLIDDKNDYVLKYHNYSVVMHKTRRFAMFSAANVNFSQRYEMSRTPDVWRTDPRIPLETQISNFYYASNKFDRGHLTRREDLEFGATPVAALQSAADTCHWTNCTPQHEKFNQNKEIWQGIERHVLENAIVKGKFKAQVITGPVLDEGDPEFKEIQYPVSYWKVVAAINADDKLVATAYIASQAEVIAHFGIEAAPVDPFGPFKTFQVPIKEIERVTGLTFTSGTALNPKPLRDVDPLNDVTAAAARRRRNRRAGPFESATVAAAGSITPAGYVELASVDDIIM